MLRKRILCVITVAATLAVAAPAFAQRQSLADRVARLEQQDTLRVQGSGQANLELQNRLTELQAEVSSLRNLVETLQNEIEQGKQRGREQYIDLDSRLARLEGRPAEAGATPSQNPAAAVAERAPAPARAAAPATASADAPDTGSSDPAAAEAAYAEALDALVERFEAAESARLFRSFLQSHPDSELVPNAWYWLGESYYVTQNYELALDSFQTALTRYPGSRKEADALLKVGYCRLALGEVAEGEAVLRDLSVRHPGTDAANKAQARLQALAREGR